MTRIQAGGDTRIDRRTFHLDNLGLATGVSAQSSRLRPSHSGWLRRRLRGRARCNRASTAFDRSTVTSWRGSSCFRRTRQALAP
jgi:hypothetical protein